MATGMPELGSKISLISKADIRYEGRLFTVDPQECTIALASVRSFGTEDRETQYQVPAQSQVYDYILFRGSDIKDIRVVNSNVSHPQPLNDPAIMQLSVPPTLGGQQYQSHPVLGHIGPQMGQFPGGAAPYGIGASVLDLIAGGSRCTTPASLVSRKSPTNDQGVQAGGSKRDDKKMMKPIQPPGGQQRNQQRKGSNSRERRDSRGDGQQHGGYYKQNHQQNHQNHQTHQNRQAMHRNQGHYQHQGQSYHQPQQQQGYHHQGHQNNQGNQQQQQQQRGGWVNRGPMRQRGRPRGGFKPGTGPVGQVNQKVKNTLKFENDYDFEQANTEFEELRTQLTKVKMEDGSTTSTTTTATTKTEVNGDVDKKDDSGNETGAGEPEVEEDHEIFYDKTKSFFDKISCEAVERAKGKSQRTDWRTERKLNSETFGAAATRRGNFRGRGGYRGMGYRGGFRGGYRQPQQRRDGQGPQQFPQAQLQGHIRTEQNTKQPAAPNVATSISKQVPVEPPMAVK